MVEGEKNRRRRGEKIFTTDGGGAMSAVCALAWTGTEIFRPEDGRKVIVWCKYTERARKRQVRVDTSSEGRRVYCSAASLLHPARTLVGAWHEHDSSTRV